PSTPSSSIIRLPMRMICASVSARARCRGVVSVISSPYDLRAMITIESTALALGAGRVYADFSRAPLSNQSHPSSGRNPMESALVVATGHLAAAIDAQLPPAGVSVRIGPRPGGRKPEAVGARTAAAAPPVDQPPASSPVHITADASDRDQLGRAAEGVDAIF